MKAKSIIPVSLLVISMSLMLGMSTLAEAGRGHHRHHHHHGHHHHGHHHHHGGYGIVYNQPRVIYNRPYYPAPGYGYNYYNPVPAPVIAPAPVYGYPPNMMLDIHTGAGHFMFSY